MAIEEIVWTKYLLGAAALAGTGTAIYYYKKSKALGKLTIDSTPAGAEVFLDGVDMNSTTPWTIELHPRNYLVTLKLAGYKDYNYTVYINSGSGTTVQATLTT